MTSWDPPFQNALTPCPARFIMEFRDPPMRIVIPVVLMMFAACARDARGQAGAGSPPASPAAPAHGKAATPNSAPGDSTSSEAYYFFSLGHLNELEFEATGRSDLAEQSIDNYKKALEIAPSSPVIMER